MRFRFRPGLLPTLAMLLVVIVCIRLGLWQQHKAEAKQALQTQLDQRIQETPVTLPEKIADPETWRYRRVTLRGSYDASHQILLDNQVDNEVAGYHVITPLKMEDSDIFVLIDRGWIAAPADRQSIPEVSTPSGVQQITGKVWLPPVKFFALKNPEPADGRWQTVWQNMDMQRYANAVSFRVQPFLVRLDPHSEAGGFVRNWPLPAERIEMHIGYAYQWYGFALAAFVIYLVVNFKTVKD